MKVDRYLMREARWNPELFREIADRYRKAAKDTYLETPDAVPLMTKRHLQTAAIWRRWEKACASSRISSLDFLEYFARTTYLGAIVSVDSLFGFPVFLNVLDKAKENRGLRDMGAK